MSFITPSPMLLLSLLLLACIVPTSFASSNPSYSTVCSPQACTELPKGQPLSLGASSLPNSDTDSASILILPGTYSSSSLPPLLGTRNASYAPLSHLNPFTNYSLSAQANPFTIAPAEAGAVFYEGKYWQGEDSLVASGRGEGTRAQSVVLGTESDSWVKLKVDGVERVLWSSVADFSQAPFLVDGTKHELEVFVVDIQSSACSIPCSHGGSCVASGSSTNGTCVCRPGFAGQICEKCAPGHYGPSCTPCSESCSSGQCADGSSSTGVCLIIPSPNATTSCNCLHGVCPPSSSSSSSTATCSCSPGFTSPNLTSSNPTFSSTYQQCSLCSEGYVAASSTECRACPVGSTSCTSEGTPTACVEGYTLELGACVASDGPSGKGSSCAGSNYWSLTSRACTPCSPLCSSCYGSGSTHCLSCPSGQALLKGVCVDVDQSNGVCDSTTVGIGLGRSANAAWYFDSSKGECDACPSTSTGCEVPNFKSSSSLRSDVVSTGCIAGYFLSLEGKCVTSCPTGSLVTETSNSTCTACDSICGSCETSPSHCLTCSDSSLVAYAGSCVSRTCPDSSVAINGTCVTCHPDCETCSGMAFNQCSTCPPGRPIRKDGRCLPVCAKNEWFDPATRSCSSCDSSCGSCLSSSPSSCTSCSQTDYTPLSGLCVPSNCSTTYVPYLQTCLSTLISQTTTSKSSSSLSKLKLALIILIILIFLLALLTFFIYRQRQKTRLATRRFADGLDDVDAAKRTAALGGVLGAMMRASEGMEDRWRNRSRSSGPGGKKDAAAGVYRLGTVKGKKGGGGRGEMKPLHLGTGWQDVQVDEFDEVLSRKGTLKKSVRSMMMAGDGEERGRRTRSGRWSPPPYSRSSSFDRDQEEYRDESPPPSPAYTSRSQYTARSYSRTHSHSFSIDDCSSSHRASNDDLRDQTFLSSGSSALGAQIIYPTLLAPPLSHARPQLFKTYPSSASAAAPPASSSSSWVDTEVQPFPDFQSSYLATRTRPAGDHSSSRVGFSTNTSSISDEHSFHHPSSRFLEDSDDDEDEEDSRTPNPFSSSHGSSYSRHIIPPRSRSPSPSPPASPTTPILPRASTYWTPSPSAEGGRHEVVIGFGRGSGLPPQRDRPGSGLSGRGDVIGSSSNNPFLQSRRGNPWFA